MNQLPEASVRAYAAAVYSRGAFRIRAEPFTLHHGGTSHLFLNHMAFLPHPSDMRVLVDAYTQLLGDTVRDTSIGAVDSIMSPVLVGTIAAQVGRPVVITKEKKTEHGFEQSIYGDPTGEVILVDDVTSTGTILINAAHALRERGATVTRAVLSACRDLSAVERLQNEGIECAYIATYEQIVQGVWTLLSEEERALVKKEVVDHEYRWTLPG